MTRDANVVHKEMGYTRAEFLRLLPKALNGAAQRTDGDMITVDDGARRLRIEMGPESERRIGNIRLPVTPVDLIFTGYSEAEVEATLGRFWRVFQRGGG